MLEDAAREFEAALQGNPREEEALLHLGLIDLKNGRAEEALGRLEAMPEEASQSYAVLRNRALALEHLGRFEDSLGLLEEAAQVNGGDPDLLLAQGIAELKGGNAEDAHATFLGFKKTLGKESPPPLFYAFAVLAAAASGFMDQAVELGREGLKLYPAEPAILVNTGAILDHKGDHEAAEQYFMRALNSGSEIPPQAYKNLGDQAFRRGDKLGARGHYEQAIKLAPSLGDDVFMKLGEIALEEEGEEMAALLLRRAVELNPENKMAKARLEELSPLP
jgi:tetratricopeptide (TPR) repeat protein